MELKRCVRFRVVEVCPLIFSIFKEESMKRAILVASALLAAGHLCAEDKGMGYGLKLRAQGGFQNVDGLENGFGFGVFTTLPVGPGAFGVELGYQTWNGKQYREPIAASNPFGLTDATAVDSRKNYADGIAGRLFFEAPISGAWGWQAGLSIAKLKSHHESITTFGTTGQYGSWAMSFDKSNMTVSPYAGVRYDLGEKGFFELNVLVSSLKVPTVEPLYDSAATGYARVTPVMGDKTITKPKIEFSYAFRF
jgi:hypothetical protein